MRTLLLLLALLIPPPAAAQDVDVTITVKNTNVPAFEVACREIARKYSKRDYTDGVTAGTLTRSHCLAKMLEDYMVPEVTRKEEAAQRRISRQEVSDAVNAFRAGFAWNPPTAACGDGVLDDHVNETCDDGGQNADHKPCVPSCDAAVCGDARVCSHPSCTSGPAGGPEECDPGLAPVLCDPTCALR